MGQVFRTRQAEEDLMDIWLHIAGDNVRAADQLLDRIDQRCHAMVEHPRSGRSCDFLGPHLRNSRVGNYMIFYRETEDGIVVIRILHGARDIERLL